MPRRARYALGEDGGAKKQVVVNVERRDVEPHELARLLRSIMGLAPDDVAEGEEAAWIGRAAPALIRDVDAGGWIAWCMVGLVVLAVPVPTKSRFLDEAKRLAVCLTMLRAEGKITRAVVALGTSRNWLRKYLRDEELYPWSGARATSSSVESVTDPRHGELSDDVER